MNLQKLSITLSNTKMNYILIIFPIVPQFIKVNFDFYCEKSQFLSSILIFLQIIAAEITSYTEIKG